MDVTGFQRRRRMLAAKAKEQEGKVNVKKETKQEPPEQLTPEVVDSMSIDDVKAKLEELEIKFTHNTGEAKLKEKLKDAITGA